MSRFHKHDYEALLQRSSRRFERIFGYGLRDPFEDICAMLRDGRAFSFSRFGDGEFNAIFGEDGMNCDGHRYFPDLGRRLGEVLERKPGYFMGLQPMAIDIHGPKRILALSEGIQWVFGDCLHRASTEGRLEGFFDALRGREIILVGPERLSGLAHSQGWMHLPVPLQNCWIAYSDSVRRLENSVSDSGTVVLFCASMMSNVLVDDLYAFNPANTYLDAGSLLDPYAGIRSRSYHYQLDRSLLKLADG